MAEEFNLSASLEELEKRVFGEPVEQQVGKVDKVDVLSNEKNTVDDLEEVTNEIIHVTPFPIEVFPQEFRETIEKVSVSTNVDAEVCASAALTVISAAIGSTVRVSPKFGWDVPLFLWMLVVALSGYGKTHAINVFVKAINRFQAVAYRKYQDLMEIYLNDSERYKKDKKAGKLPVKPVLQQYKVSDTTIEAMADVLESQSRGVLIDKDEFSGFMLSLNQYKGGKGSDRQHILELFNCEPWKIDRKSGSRFIPNTGASIIGGLQPQVMPNIFCSDSFADGLLPRFLLVIASNKIQRFSKIGVTVDDLAYWDNFISWCYGIELKMDASGYVKPQVLILSRDALDIWESFYNEYNELAAFLPVRLKVFIPKLITYSLKYIGILHVLYSFESRDIKDVVSVETVANAIKLTRFYAGQVVTLVKQYDKPGEAFNEYDNRMVQTLNKLQEEVKNCKLPLSKIAEEFNTILPERLKIKNNKVIGTILRNLGLITKESTNGVYFLTWEDKKIKKLLRSTSTLSTSSTSNVLDEIFEVETIEEVLK